MYALCLFAAFFGIVYAAYALLLGTSFMLPVQREEIERKTDEIRAQAAGGGWRGFLFGLGKPLYWLVALPMASVPGAFFVAVLMLLPALAFKP